MSFDPRTLFAKLRFKHLQLLAVLGDTKSLSGAALQLHLTQPALSKALGEIEAAFDVQLFVRLARGVEPTEQGQLVIQGAVMLLQELAHLGQEASQKAHAMILRIGAPPFVAQGYLPAVLAALADYAPHVRVQLVEERVPLLIEHLLEGKLDALISSYPTERPDAAAYAMRYEKLFETHFTVIAPKNHPAAQRKHNTWAELTQHSWILPSNASMLRRIMEEVFRREGVMAPLPVIESTSPLTNVQLVKMGLGLSVVPSSTLALLPKLTGVRAVAVERGIFAGQVALITRDQAENPRLQVLRAVLAQMPPP